MGTSAEKHARQKERRDRLNEARQEVEAQAKRRRLITIVASVIVVAIAIGVIVALTGGGDDETADDAATTTVADLDTTTTTGAPPEASELPAPPPGISLTGETPCPPAEGAAERVQVFAGPPPDCLTPGASYTATFSTSLGDFTAELDVDAAPIAVNNFVVLSRYRYYDGVPFHRVVPGFVIQAGDGDGAPWGNNDLGYSFEDELPDATEDYVDYSLAMANAGPDTNGSQFFVVLPGGGAQLQPLYTLFGQVVEGQEIVDAIGELGGGPNDQPVEVVLINSVTITETPG